MPENESQLPQPLLLTPAEVVQLLQLDARDLKRMRDRNEGPRFHQLGARTIRYSATGVRKWMQDRVSSGDGDNDRWR
jgi:predicted DNA-binding transcriptional regulator AlpA